MIKLTDAQQDVYDDLVSKIHNHKGRSISVIKGYAGTGKSTLISKIISDMSDYYSIATTSPTHKANAVLRGMINDTDTNHDDVVISTIHSFLGLKLVYEKNKQVLKHDPKSPNANRKVDILIVDECSMISELLYKHIMDQISRVRRAVIFIGDPCQLPPVDTENVRGVTNLSPTFDIPNQYSLTEVLRQALDNPIISVATKIRECIGTNIEPMSYVHGIMNEDTMVRLHDEDEFLEIYKSYIETESSTELFQNVSNNKIISYTNYKVNLYNRIIRSSLFPEHTEEEFITGEPIIFDTVTENCPYTVQEMIRCPKIEKHDYIGIPCWKFFISPQKSILVVGPETVHAYEAFLDDLVDKINRKDKNPLTKQEYRWTDYYLLKGKINVVNYPYAITVHKSQGSTFENLWFNTSYIDNITEHDTKCRIIYTALTRPKHMVLLL